MMSFLLEVERLGGVGFLVDHVRFLRRMVVFYKKAFGLMAFGITTLSLKALILSIFGLSAICPPAILDIFIYTYFILFCLLSGLLPTDLRFFQLLV